MNKIKIYVLNSARFVDKTSLLDGASLRKNDPEFLIVHSTHSYPDFDSLMKKHKQNGWAGVGYHLFAPDHQTMYLARPLDVEGAHALGFNTKSIGLCIYTPQGKADRKMISFGRDFIAGMKRANPDLKVIPHTLAQVIYNNSLLEKEGFPKFSESDSVARESEFLKLKKQMDELTGRLDTSKYFKLKQSLKQFKNCPGEIYYELM